MPAGFTHNWGQLDEAVWNWNPHQNQPGNFYRNPAEGNHFGGSWRRTLATPDLAGFCRYLVEFCTDSRPIKNYAPNDGDQRGYGFGFLQQEAADGVIPAAPQARYTGRAGFPVAELPFATTPFAPLSGTNRFAAVQWRVGEISAPGRPGFVPGRPRKYELEPFWTSPEIATNASPLQLPDGLCRSNHTYRVRARYKDQTGRWGHWSPPVQFVAGP